MERTTERVREGIMIFLWWGGGIIQRPVATLSFQIMNRFRVSQSSTAQRAILSALNQQRIIVCLKNTQSRVFNQVYKSTIDDTYMDNRKLTTEFANKFYSWNQNNLTFKAMKQYMVPPSPPPLLHFGCHYLGQALLFFFASAHYSIIVVIFLSLCSSLVTAPPPFFADLQPVCCSLSSFFTLGLTSDLVPFWRMFSCMLVLLFFP